MKLRNPTLIRLLARLAALVIRLWMSTLRLRIRFGGGEVHPTDAQKERYIYAFWHESLLAMTIYRARIHLLISRHADGEFIAQVCQRIGYEVVRGSSTRGGTEALRQMMSCCGQSHLGVTPDGPRGPRRQLKTGVVYLASRTGLPVVPVGVGLARAWRAGSWDRLVIPGLFSTMACVFGPAIAVPADLDRDGLERYRQLVEERCLEVTAAAEQWAETGIEPPIEEKRNEERRSCA